MWNNVASMAWGVPNLISTQVRSARMVDTLREAPPPSWAGVPTNGWDDVFPETKRWLEGFDAVSADQVSLKTVVSAVSIEEEGRS